MTTIDEIEKRLRASFAPTDLTLVDESAMQSRAVGLRDTEVCVFAKHSKRRRRLVLSMIIPARKRG